MFNVGLIDSLRLRVRMTDVVIIDKRIVEDYIAYYPSLAALDDDNQPYYETDLKKAPPYTKIIQGITYRFFPKAFINHLKYAEEYMVFQISAKMCKHRYFEGLTLHNISDVVRDINGLGVLKVTEKAFLNGLVSDIDICINQLIDAKSLRSAFSLINRFPRPSKKPLLHTFQQINNIGIDFNKREKGTNTAPYCKIYHKGHELSTKSSDFYAAFLSPLKKSVLDNLVRYEFTVKASKHKKYLQEQGFNADFKTLSDLLKTPQEDLKAIAKSGLSLYLETPIKSSINTDNRPMEIVILYLMENLIKSGFEEGKILGFEHLINDPSQKSRTKSKIKNLLQQLTSENDYMKEKLQENTRSNAFLSNLGFYIP